MNEPFTSAGALAKELSPPSDQYLKYFFLASPSSIMLQ
jgi:hypothetical protein